MVFGGRRNLQRFLAFVFVVVVTAVSFKWQAREMESSSHRTAKSSMSTLEKPQIEAINITQKWLVDGIQGQRPWILLVHIGKTGGSSLRRSLLLDMTVTRKKFDCLVQKHEEVGLPLQRAMEKCQAKLSKTSRARSYFAQRILSVLHVYHKTQFTPQQHDWMLEHANTLLITTRLPVARLRSNFYYRRQNLFGEQMDYEAKQDRLRGAVKFYRDCFATFEELARALSNNDSSFSTSCRDLGRDIVQGKIYVEGMNHFDTAYHHYTQATIDKRPDKQVVVVRTEYFEKDAHNLALALGDKKADFNNHVNKGKQSSKTSAKKKTKKSFNSRAQEKVDMTGICCQMIDDLIAYQRIISLAVNLHSAEKEESLRGSIEECISPKAGSNPSSNTTNTYSGRHIFDWDWTEWHRMQCNDDFEGILLP